MKKLVQICSLLVLVAAFYAVSAQAQNGSRIEAKVPFSFKLGEKTYKAGDYVVRLTTENNTVNMVLEDAGGKKLETLAIFETDEAASGKSRVVFGYRENQQFLSKIIAGDKTFSLDSSAAKKQPVEKKNVDSK